MRSPDVAAVGWWWWSPSDLERESGGGMGGWMGGLDGWFGWVVFLKATYAWRWENAWLVMGWKRGGGAR